MDNADTKTVLTECFINEEFKLLDMTVDIRAQFIISDDLFPTETEQTEEKEEEAADEVEGASGRRRRLNSGAFRNTRFFKG